MTEKINRNPNKVQGQNKEADETWKQAQDSDALLSTLIQIYGDICDIPPEVASEFLLTLKRR